jgi:hypothetical protein
VFVVGVVAQGLVVGDEEVAHVVQQRGGHQRRIGAGPLGQLGALQGVGQRAHRLLACAVVGDVAVAREEGFEPVDDAGRVGCARRGRRRRRHRTHHTSRLRSCAETRSMTDTDTTSISSTAAVCAYWKPRITSHSTMPMPPAPTMPTTEAERTLASKR